MKSSPILDKLKKCRRDCSKILKKLKVKAGHAKKQLDIDIIQTKILMREMTKLMNDWIGSILYYFQLKDQSLEKQDQKYNMIVHFFKTKKRRARKDNSVIYANLSSMNYSINGTFHLRSQILHSRAHRYEQGFHNLPALHKFEVSIFLSQL